MKKLVIEMEIFIKLRSLLNLNI